MWRGWSLWPRRWRRASRPTPCTVEEHCETLVGQQLLRPLGVTTWPNGTVAARYAFVHALYQQVVYERLGAGRRVRLHQRLGDVSGDGLWRAGGRDRRRAGGALCARPGYPACRALSAPGGGECRPPLCPSGSHQAPDPRRWRCSPAGRRRRSASSTSWTCSSALGAAWATRGWAAPEVGADICTGSKRCAHQVEETPRGALALLLVCAGRWRRPRVRGTAASHLAQRRHDPVLLFAAHMVLGMTLFRGRGAARAHPPRAGEGALCPHATPRASLPLCR